MGRQDPAQPFLRWLEHHRTAPNALAIRLKAESTEIRQDRSTVNLTHPNPGCLLRINRHKSATDALGPRQLSPADFVGCRELRGNHLPAVATNRLAVLKGLCMKWLGPPGQRGAGRSRRCIARSVDQADGALWQPGAHTRLPSSREEFIGERGAGNGLELALANGLRLGT